MILRTIGNAVAREATTALANQFPDSFVVWNSFIHVETWAFDAYEKYLKSGKRLVCAETPYIGRDRFDNGKGYPVDDVPVRVGLGDVSTYHPKHFNIKEQKSYDRLDMMKDKYNFSIAPWRSDGDHILVATQVPNDSSLRGIDIWSSLQYDLIKLRESTNRPIIIRPHPVIESEGWAKQRFNQSTQNYSNFLKVADMVGATIETRKSSKELLDGCWAVVVYSSGFSFDALIRGIPVITLSNRNFAAPICSHFPEEVESPKMQVMSRLHFLSNAAWCEWTPREIKEGKCKEHLLS